MGKCLTIVKLSAITSLGLSTAAYGYVSQKLENPAGGIILNLRKCIFALGSISTYLFYQAYTRSPAWGKHPYLLYAAAAIPIALGTSYGLTDAYKNEQRLVNDDTTKTEKVVKKVTVEEKSELDGSVYGDVGRPVEREIVEEVTVNDLGAIVQNLKQRYLYNAVIVGTGFLLSVVGYLGDNM
ncbi:hypothetical protein DAMA08_044450 [Martiniozyma asiatica (nom. inval.)]|nr:hypothetical protein DAMA08_044450 [Martiniozyma asiatica]